MAALIPLIHHEKQEPGSMLCAQHALNSLLQGQYFDPSQLSEIAQNLDELEKTQMDEQAWNKRGKDKSSLNMDDTGFFSLSVLEQALSVWGLTLERWRSSKMKPYQDHPEDQNAFVLNLESHWFSFRRFGGKESSWYNLNSFLPAPQWVGPKYLGALLNQAETEGYSIFSVRSLQQDDNMKMEIPTIFLSSEADEMAMSSGSSGFGSSSGGDMELMNGRARASGSGKGSGNWGAGDDEDEELEAALKASLMDSNPENGSGSTSNKSKKNGNGSNVRRHRSHESQDGEEEQEETDEHLDLIAPFKKKNRGKERASSRKGSQDIEEDEGEGRFGLPTVSGRRRRGSSKLRDEDDDLEEGSSNGLAKGKGRSSESKSKSKSGGTSKDNAISVDSDDEDGNATLQKSPFLNPALRDQDTGVIDVDDLDSGTEDEDEGDDEPKFMGQSKRKTKQNGNRSRVVDDYDEIEQSLNLQQEEIDQVKAHARIKDRFYDDEDAEFQAALAASLAENEDSSAFKVNSQTPDRAGGSSRSRNDEDFNFQKWQNFKTPPPDDVAKIARNRELARIKEKEDREEKERIKRGEVKVAPVEVDGKKGDEEEKEEEEEEEEEEPSPEEIRRRRLARFGA